MAGFDNDQVIGSIPVLSATPEQSMEYTDLVHINVQYNPSSFAVVPVGVRSCDDVQVVRAQTTLFEIRRYLDTVLLSHMSPKPNYSFLSRNGGRIAMEQERDVLAWNEVTEEEWSHHTFSTLVTRYHLFIVLNPDDITVRASVRHNMQMINLKRKRTGNEENERSGLSSEATKDAFRRSDESTNQELVWYVWAG